MNKEALQGDWDTDFQDSENNNDGGQKQDKIPYIKFDRSANYRVRLVGGFVKYLKYWKPINAITHPEYKDDDPVWQAGFYPSTRFAIHAIDRSDGQLKILERGNGLFKHFHHFKAVHNINPSGRDSPDFIITVKIPKDKSGNPNKLKTEYEVEAARENSPLTEEEVKLYKEKRVPLAKIYSTTPLEKIKELWDALPDEKKIPPVKKSGSSDDNDNHIKETESGKSSSKSIKEEKVEEKIEETIAPTNDDDVFGGSKNEEDSTELF